MDMTEIKQDATHLTIARHRQGFLPDFNLGLNICSTGIKPLSGRLLHVSHMAGSLFG